MNCPGLGLRGIPAVCYRYARQSASGRCRFKGIAYVCRSENQPAPRLSSSSEDPEKASGAITAMALVGAGALSSIAYADALTKAQRDKLVPTMFWH